MSSGCRGGRCRDSWRKRDELRGYSPRPECLWLSTIIISPLRTRGIQLLIVLALELLVHVLIGPLFVFIQSFQPLRRAS